MQPNKKIKTKSSKEARIETTKQLAETIYEPVITLADKEQAIELIENGIEDFIHCKEAFIINKHNMSNEERSSFINDLKEIGITVSS